MTVGAWPHGPCNPDLRAGEIHVWQAHLDGWPADELRGKLTSHELARAAQIVRPSARARWIVARGLLRTILESYLQVEEVPLAVETTGRPYLVAGPVFSVSHSRGLALYALAAEGNLGVDVEIVRDDLRVAPLRRRLAAADSSTAHELLGRWTRREAAFKCGDAWPWLQSINLGAQAVATLASTASPTRTRTWTLDAFRRPMPDSPTRGTSRAPYGAPLKILATGSRP